MAEAAAATPVEVSVIMPVRDEAATLPRALDSVFAQVGVEFEVVVVDNGSTDGTARLLRERAATQPRLVIVHQGEPSIPRSLNAALEVARGRWLVRVDAHSTISPGYLAHAVTRLEEGRWSGVGGRKAAVGTGRAGRAIAAVLNSRYAVGGSVYHWGTHEQVVDHVPFGCYPTATVRELGGWDEDIAANEDFELDQRLRALAPLLFDPALSIDWHARESIGDLFRQYRRYGRGKPAVALRHPSSMSPRHLAPPALLVWLAGCAVIAPRRPALAATGVGLYAGGIGLLTALISRRAPVSAPRSLIPAALVAMQVGWGAGFWHGALDVVRSGVVRSRVVRSGVVRSGGVAR